MKDLIAATLARLAERVTEARYIDEDWGQLDAYSANPPVKWPCILVDLSQATWSNQGRHIQTGMAEIYIRLADLRLSPTNQRASANQKQKASELWDVITNIHKALHTWAPNTHTGSLTRTATRRINRDDGVREFVITYQCTVTDNSAMPQEYTVMAQPQITLQG